MTIIQKGEPMTRDEFMDLVGADYVDEYEKAQLSQEDATIVAKSKRTFVELLVHYPHPDVCTYPEHKGKPYYSIKYIEDGECFVGFGTYNPEVLSQYLRDYFMPPAQPEYEPVTAEDFAKTMSETSVYSYMLWHSEALTLMKKQGFVICKKTM